MPRTRAPGTRPFEVTSLDKVFFPDEGITKGDLIAYYERVSGVMLPHVRGRIVTMHRYPNGIAGQSFYQKNVPDYFPDWIHTVEVSKQGGVLRQLTIEQPDTLSYLVNQGCIEMHVWPSRADKPDHPDRVIFDLDPSNDDFALVRRAALAVRGLLDELGLRPFVMTTGSRGLHVVAPLDRTAGFDAVRAFASQAARLLAARDPVHFTVEQRKNKRGSRVFIDYMRNAWAQHGVAPYSVRAKPGAPVAAPLRWDELGASGLRANRYTTRNLFRRLARTPDPWKDIERDSSSIAEAQRRLNEVAG